jgi:hypothetical protein
MGHIVVTLVCECGRSLHAEGHGPTTAGLTTSRLLVLARSEGWARERVIGWRCPKCQETHHERPTAAA